jgi:hypothetical protein
MSKNFSFGIDLGTSNCAAALFTADDPQPASLEITQLLSPESVGEKKLLPSALYLPHPDEFPSGLPRMPWNEEEADALAGAFARERGAVVPDRFVTSAKSWLCQHQVDRKAAILPWKSDWEEGKISPFDASRRYLSHLRHNFEYHLGEKRPLQEGEVVVTVPASFDEAARSLTREAAEAAGFANATLLEEPLAAFYAWIHETGDAWRDQLSPGDTVLICDIGGGTADFSLIAVSEKDGNLDLERISVGEHILLGGDNVDLALAYTLRADLEENGTEIDDWQFLSLIHSCRLGKEKLFADGSLENFPISIPSRGSSLFAKTVSVQLRREQLERVALDGFLPILPITETPQARRSAGLQEFGLAYASDPVITKHLAQFLTRSLEVAKSNETLGPKVDAGATFLRPTAILFNGGVFNAPPLRQRVLEILSSWSNGAPVKELAGGHLDLSVARGAAAYGWTAVSGKGIRIRAGAPRAYYIGLETSQPAVPGFRPPVKAVCVVPQGMEEGTEQALEEREFGLVTGEAVTFRFFSSTERPDDNVGQVVANAERDLEETTNLEITLEPTEGLAPGEVVPVRLHSVLTELGTLELWMQHATSDKRWKLEFNVRGKE